MSSTFGLIEGYLINNPGASYQKVLKFCKNNIHQNEYMNIESHISSSLRKLRKEGKVINNRNSWYLKKEKSS
ncbi:hypothetical protein CVD28_05225 [Bacillus sp. M6-12]|nr:hypothetical protein CVD28_05225 [Bacillus sp. M6-12]